MLEKIFKLSQNGTNVKTEIIAGLTTFMTMAYILIVNPILLSKTGMDFGALITATALSSIVATLIMAFYANMPFALAPGMGLNAFFAFTVVLSMGYSWEFALTAVFIEGLIFIVLTFFNLREAIINSIPTNLKHAISGGIGLFIAFIGLQGAEIISSSPATLLTLGNILKPAPLVAIFGLVVAAIFHVNKIKGSLLAGIVSSTVLAVFVGVTNLPANMQFFSSPASLAPIAFKFDFSNVFTIDMVIILFTFLFVDMFDTVGTLVGVASKAKMLDKDGKLPGAKKALFADAIGTTVGAALGTSTVTTYIESAAGVEEGGKTGLTAFVVAICFFFSLFLSPLFIMIPKAATAPALIIVGLFMLSPIKEIDLEDFTEALPAFFTIIMMPLAFSIADGIAFGVIFYVLLKVLSGKKNDLSLLTVLISIIFLIKYLIPLFTAG